MKKWFITRIPSKDSFTWEAYEAAYKKAQDEKTLYDSKYMAIGEARGDTTNDLLYICAKWIDPPKGTTHSSRSYGHIYQKGEEIK